MKYLFAFFILIVVLSSCDWNQCVNEKPLPSFFEINLIDSLENSLVGSVYVKDSFRLYSANSEQYIRPIPYGNPSLLQIYFSKIESASTYYLELDASDTDTLEFVFSSNKGKCGTSYTMYSINYNGTQVQISSQNTYGLFK